MYNIRNDLTIRFGNTLSDEGRFIREQVFVEEQGFEIEFDRFDTDTNVTHLVILKEEQPLATGRLIPVAEGVFAIGRVAVLKEYRALHLGSRILDILETKAKDMGAYKTQLSAQCRAQRFYENNGYRASGDIYKEEFCDHIHMEKILD